MATPLEIQTCINNLTSSNQPIDFTLLAAETSDAGTGISFSVPTVNDLPDLETTNIGRGQIIFVESIGVPVVSTETEWRGLDGRLLRRDFFVKEIYAWGVNNCGQLGNGTVTSRCSPVQEFYSATDWCGVSAGCDNTAAVKTSGQIWAWGVNNCGQLGDGTVSTRASPVREFCSATDWCQVSAGFTHTVAVKTTGQIWAWGSGSAGRLGDGTQTTRASPVREFCSATDWCQVGVGYFHSAAVKTTGQIWTWGSNLCGRLGDGTTVTSCSPVQEFYSATDWCGVSAFASTAGIKTTGEIWTWGSNSVGHLGDGSTVPKCSPVREISSSTDWCRINVGSNNAVAIKTTGQLWAWGAGICGGLGDGTLTARCSPVREFCSATDWCQASAGTGHAAAVKTSGQLWAWGCNICGKLGDGTVATRCSPVREISSSTNWCQVSTGTIHTAAIINR